MSEEKSIGEISRPIRGSDWFKDGVGIDEQGNICIQTEDSPYSCFSMSRRAWCVQFKRHIDLEDKIYQLERQVNAQEPSRWLAKAISTLEKSAQESESLSDSTPSGRVMLGQRQAYNDAIATLRTYIK